MDKFIQDVRYGWRMLAKNPAFTIVILLMLALGIGANTAVFTMFSATLLRSLPFQKPEELVQVWDTRTDGVFQQMEMSYPDFVDVRARNHVFSQMGGYSARSVTLSSKGGAEQAAAIVADSGFFQTLGVQPILGRSFLPEEDNQNSQSVVILTYGAWQRRFGSDPNVVGKSLVLDGRLSPVVGVLPQNFAFAPSQSADFWISPRVRGWELRRNAHWFHPVGRLKPGVSLLQAQADLTSLAHQLQQEHPDTNATVGEKIIPLKDELVGAIRPALMVLLASVGFVLLITCANVAGLLLARSLARQKEISVRVALGATRGRIARQLLTEAIMLSLLGGAAGVFTAYWCVPAIMSAIPKEQLLSVPSLQHLTLDRTVLLFSLTLSVVTGMLFGLMPALQAFKTDMQQGLQEGGRSSVGSAHYRVRNTLVVVEVSLAVVLLAGAGLMLKSLHHLLDVDPGFRTENLLTVSVALPRDRYPDDAHLLAFHKRLLQNTVTLPGVRDAATVDIVPLSSSGNTSRFDIEGHPKASGGAEFEANSRSISENYFGVMGIPLRDGRLFGSEDNLQSRHVVIVNQALVNLVFQNQNPIGKRINFTYSGEPDLWEVVGVVADENVGSLDQKATPVIYTSVTQEPQRYFSLALRTTGDPKALVSSVRQRVTEIDPEVPAFAMASMKEIISSSPTILLHSYPAYLIATFAGLALLLAALGIYGLLTYSVAQRTRELGLRMALGAKQSDLFQLVVGNGLKLTVIGVLIGFVAALGILRLIASLLFGVGSADPATFIAVAGLIIASSTLASYLPARRASQIDPMIALRCE